MSIESRLVTCVLIVAVFSGCGGSESPLPSSTAPTPVTLTPSGSARGEIRVSAVTPSANSALTVHDCGPSWTGINGRHVCTEEWRGSFDVAVDRDVAGAVLTVSFEGASGRCGMVYVTDLAFAKGRVRPVTASNALFLTYEPEGYPNLAVVQYCHLPAATERLVVQLWDPGGGVGSAARPLLHQEFNYAYRFGLR